MEKKTPTPKCPDCDLEMYFMDAEHGSERYYCGKCNRIKVVSPPPDV